MDSLYKSAARKELWPLGLALILCLLILWFPMGVSKSDLRIPFAYNGEDDFAHCVFMKGVVDGGWFLHNNLLGAPFGADLHDFPINDNFSLAIVKFMGFFTSDFGLIFNLFLLLNYPLTVLVTYPVLRHFKLGYAASIVGSLLYTFLPYHYTRAIGHCFYSVYYAVPLMTLVLLWIVTGTLKAQDLFSLAGLRQNKGKVAICGLTIFLISSTGGFYYAFFGLFLLGVAGLLVILRERNWRAVILPAAIGAMIVGMLAINVFPNLLYFSKYGRTEAVVRTPAEAEYGGLKISSLLLPLQYHVIDAFAAAKVLSLNNPLTTENQDSTLGVFGSMGFLFLLGYVLFRQRGATDEDKGHPFPLLRYLSVFNLAAVLFATIGGFGSLFALLVWAQIRGYNRIVVYLAFFSFLALFLLSDYWAQQYARQSWQRTAYLCLLGIVLILGIVDLRGKFHLRNGGILTDTYNSDHDFVKSIEAQLPEQAMIFQLPYTPFPETKGPGKMHDYDHVRGYFNSNRLRWSFGAMKGRPADLWQQSVSTQPVPELVASLAKAGFSGIYVDRFGYEDQGKKVEAELAQMLGPATLVSRNNRLSFFNLTTLAQRLREKYAPAEWKEEQENVLYPPLMAWQKGFYGVEALGQENWRWGQATAVSKIINSSPQEKQFVVEASFAALSAGKLEIQSPFWKATVSLSSTATPYTQTITVPPGEHLIHFQCDVPRTPIPNDDRALIFRINNFTLKAAAQKKPNDSGLNLSSVVWDKGFYDEESLGSDKWHWGQATSIAKITNSSPQEKRFVVEASFGALGTGNLTIQSPFWQDTLHLSTSPTPYSQTITVPPGEHLIHFQCDVPRTPIPNDDRSLSFRVNNFMLKPTE